MLPQPAATFGWCMTGVCKQAVLALKQNNKQQYDDNNKGISDYQFHPSGNSKFPILKNTLKPPLCPQRK